MPWHFLPWILMLLLGITWYKNLLMILRSLPKLSHCETTGTSTPLLKTDCQNFHTWSCESCLQHGLFEHFIRKCRLNTQISCYQQDPTSKNIFDQDVCTQKTTHRNCTLMLFSSNLSGTLTWNPKCQQNIRPSKHQRTRQLVLLKSGSKMQKGLHFCSKNPSHQSFGGGFELLYIILERTWEDLDGFGASAHWNTSTCFPHSRNGL